MQVIESRFICWNVGAGLSTGEHADDKTLEQLMKDRMIHRGEWFTSRAMASNRKGTVGSEWRMTWNKCTSERLYLQVVQKEPDYRFSVL